LTLLAVCLALTSCGEKPEISVSQVSMKWTYDVPAEKYREGLPIGTGRFASMSEDFLAPSIKIGIWK
jgi:hypothetical protein